MMTIKTATTIPIIFKARFMRTSESGGIHWMRRPLLEWAEKRRKCNKKR